MNVVSFFAGCGGLDLGSEQAGFNVVWVNEYEQLCCATRIHNHPSTEFVLGDICKIDPNLGQTRLCTAILKAWGK